MNPGAPTILFVREVPWDAYYPISTRRLAERFAAAAWNVIWLTTPLMPWHRRARDDLERARLDCHRAGGRFAAANVFWYTPRTRVPFSRSFPLDRPALARAVWRACAPALPAVLRRAGVPAPDVIWASIFWAAGLPAVFGGVPLVAHVHDHFAGYPSAPRTTEAIEAEQVRAAARVACATESLRRRVAERFGVTGAALLPPGVDLDAYRDDLAEPEALRGLPRPRLVALGNTAKLDHDALAAAARAAGGGTVVVAGPATPALRALAAAHPAIRPIGPVAAAHVPALLLHCDLGLILLGHALREAGRHMLPMKLYEYAAAGLPVIATPLPGYHDVAAPVRLAATPEAVAAAVPAALGERAALAAAMRAFARGASWQARYAQARELIAPLLPGARPAPAAVAP